MFPNFYSPFAVFDLGFWVVVAALVTIAIHFFFASGVKEDAEQLRAEKRGPLFVSPIFWALATLLGGFPIVALYWLMHHSTLSTLPKQ